MVDMVNEDARFTVKEIAASVGVSSRTVHKILTQEIQLLSQNLMKCLQKEQKTTRVRMT